MLLTLSDVTIRHLFFVAVLCAVKIVARGILDHVMQKLRTSRIGRRQWSAIKLRQNQTDDFFCARDNRSRSARHDLQSSSTIV